MERRLGDPQHTIAFYDSDAELVSQLVRFVADGLAADEAVIVIATPEHVAELDAALAGAGVDLAAAVDSGRYQPCDASQALAGLLVDGFPDRERFAATIASAVDEAQARGLQVRVFGEVVALLWAGGEQAATVLLERFGEDLAESRGVEVLCAYPTCELEPDRLGSLAEVLARHTRVIAPESYREGGREHHGGPAEPGAARRPGRVDGGEQVFVPVPTAIAAARRLVSGALWALDDDSLTYVATLVVSELATNAVVHARSPFRVGVRESGRAVRIEVEDSSPAAARQRPVDRGTPGGRGIPLVERVSARWGTDPSDSGKVVWSDLLLTGTFHRGSVRPVGEVQDRYGSVAAGFRRRLDGVGAGDWASQTPCTDWTVADLVAHVVGVHRRVVATVAGREPAEVDPTGDLPAQWQEACDAVLDALGDETLAETTVSGMFGEQTFESLVSRLLCADTLVHTWDLARATAQDESLDADAVGKALLFLAPIDDAIRRPGGFSAKIEPGLDADEQTRLLNFCGRAV